MRLSYRPKAPYPYNLEIFRLSDLKQRTREERMRVTYRYEFHMLMCITHGECVQWIDFEPVSCRPGTLLLLRPGQAHNFGRDDHWDGWVVLFRPEFLLPNLPSSNNIKCTFDFEKLPDFLHLDGDEFRRVSESIARMQEDALLKAASEDVHALLRYQFYALVTWLGCMQVRKQENEVLCSRELPRFMQFKTLVEQHFTEWNQVDDYARWLGCTPKSLTRATSAAVGMSAKAYISTRINLEAKRLLAHTDLPVGVIASKLGFEEATHFIKFFKREVGSTPTEFRRQQLAENVLSNAKS